MTDYPRPPRLPVLSSATLSLRRQGRRALPSMLDQSEAHFLWRGSTAMDAAFRIMGLESGDEVLLPAYHCVSMVEPVLRHGATPVFYPIRPDTLVEPDSLRAICGPSTRCVVVPHYFGFHQPMAEIRAVCDELGIVLIEDCAHCLFGRVGEHPVGSMGHFAIGSPWKFLPVMEGGCLVINDPQLQMVHTDRPGLRAELKSLLNNIERALDHGRLRASAVLFRPLIRLSALGSSSPSGESDDGDPRVANAKPLASLRGMTRVSRMIIRYTDMERAVSVRRENYRRLHHYFQDMKGAKPLHQSLPQDVAPQVYPLVMEAPEAVFPGLQEAGVAIIRFGEYLWEGLDPSVCPVSQDLSRRVFQVPCHQELSQAEVDWLGTTIRQITDEHTR